MHRALRHSGLRVHANPDNELACMRQLTLSSLHAFGWTEAQKLQTRLSTWMASRGIFHLIVKVKGASRGPNPAESLKPPFFAVSVVRSRSEGSGFQTRTRPYFEVV